jgi:hypothetical protein
LGCVLWVVCVGVELLKLCVRKLWMDLRVVLGVSRVRGMLVLVGWKRLMGLVSWVWLMSRVRVRLVCLMSLMGLRMSLGMRLVLGVRLVLLVLWMSLVGGSGVLGLVFRKQSLPFLAFSCKPRFILVLQNTIWLQNMLDHVGFGRGEGGKVNDKGAKGE